MYDASTLARTADHVVETSSIAPHIPDFGRVKNLLRSSVGDDVYQSWFARLQLEYVGEDTIYLTVPTIFLRSWLIRHYAERIRTACQVEYPSIKSIDIEVRRFAPYVPTRGRNEHVNGALRLVPPQQSDPKSPQTNTNVDSKSCAYKIGSPLMPAFRFDTYVRGRNNKLAVASVEQLADSPSDTLPLFDILYLHGDTGVGKTHLLQALAHAGPAIVQRSCHYITCDKFMQMFAQAITLGHMFEFKAALRSVDVLMIDNIQELRGTSSQKELMYLLKALNDAGRPVIVASDRPPSELESFDPNLLARLTGGLVIEIGKHPEEMRHILLERAVEAVRTANPEFVVSPQVLAHLASKLSGNGRMLEGAISRLCAWSHTHWGPVTTAIADKELQAFLAPPDTRRVRIEDVQRVVARHYQVSRSDLLSARRTANIVRPRQVAMYLAKTLTLRSLPEIGRRFGGRDHTTVLHAVRKMEALVARDAAFSEEVQMLSRAIQGL